MSVSISSRASVTLAADLVALGILGDPPHLGREPLAVGLGPHRVRDLEVGLSPGARLIRDRDGGVFRDEVREARVRQR